MKLKTSYLVLKTDSSIKESSSQLRGYIGKKFGEYPILHHHIKNGDFLYTYPKVQYKVIEGTASILGIEEGAKVLKEISDDLNELVLGKNTYKIQQKVIYGQEFDVRTGKKTKYRFITPWIALNAQNYRLYQELDNWKDKKIFLNKILVGNILSMCKGLGIIVNRKLYAHSLLDPQKIEYKGLDFSGFAGEFKVNFKIPDFFGLGKGVSQGFGTIKEVENADADNL